MIHKVKLAALLPLMLLCLTRLTVGQELAATLSGTVTDPSGAAVIGASVLVHDNETGTDVRTVTTNSTGSFTITNIPAGRYVVTIRSVGFQTYTVSDLTLNVADRRSLEVQLKPGRVSEIVSVTAETAPIQTTTSEESGTVTGTQVRELALNSRNYQQLVLLQPGVSSQLPDVLAFGINSTGAISVNGARTSSNNWTVDGADINDSGNNGNLNNAPSIDAIQEFTLKRSSYDAAYGRSGGGQILVATKSGTDAFHGTAYEFSRNNYYNALPVTGGPAPIERYNDFGFTVGGPLFVPGLPKRNNDKTYFFWSEEWRKAKSPGTNPLLVPSAANLTGVFQHPIPVAPAGCVTASGGTYQIKATCYSQNAAAYLNAFIAPNPPNDPNGQNIEFVNYSSLNNFRQDIIRLDQNIGTKVRAYARYMQDSVPLTEAFGLFTGNGNYPGVENVSTQSPGRNLIGNVTWLISPRVVNELEYANTWGAITSSLSGFEDSPALLSQLTNINAYPDISRRIPGVSISGVTGVATGYAPYFERNRDRNVFDNISFALGNHTLRAGFTAMWMNKTENSAAAGTTPVLGFTGANGNPAFANFLLGQADYYFQSNRYIVPDLHYVNLEGYLQDDWKVTPRLTLNAGLRYSYFPSPTDSNNTLNNFDPTLFQSQSPTFIDPVTGNFAVSGVTSLNYVNGIIFPTGAACRDAQAIVAQVTCSPYGRGVNQNTNKNFAPRLGVAWDVFGTGKTAVRAGYGVFFDRTLNGLWEENAFQNPPLLQTTFKINDALSDFNLFDNPLGGASGVPNTPISLYASGNPRFRVPSYQNWNLSFEQEILRDTMVSVAYVGAKGVHLLGEVDINQPTLQARQKNPTTQVNALAPYLGYGAITDRVPAFSSNYNSLQVTLNHRVTHDLSVGVAYTWSKNLTNNPQDRYLSTYNTYNFNLSYGLSNLNTPQIFVVSYVYEFPFYKSQQGMVGHLLGGWELSGITSIQSGQSLPVNQYVDPFTLAGYPGGMGMIQGNFTQIRADQIGDPKGPKTPGTYFNTAAFADAVGHFGTSAPGVVSGPGFQRWDLSAIKNVKFGERARLQLRLEAFNAFNHGNPSSIDTNVDDGSTFGKVNGYHDARKVQLGAKIYF
jgi:hypothetical protein